jgi:phosphoglycolate phosphatase
MKADSRRLVLWDIDGTILHGGRLWAESFMESFRAHFAGSGEWKRVSFSGKTDRQICRELMQVAGHWRAGVEPGSCSEQESRIDAVLRGYLDRARAGVVERGHEIKLLPGVREVIAELGRRPEVTQGLLTGNVREGAWLKLGSVGLRAEFGFGEGEGGWLRAVEGDLRSVGLGEATGGVGAAAGGEARAGAPLGAYEGFGAFGCDHWDRYQLPRIAVERAKAELGIEFVGKQVVIIGDTIHDVGCGQSIGARAIGVGTGQPDARARVLAAWRGEPAEAGDPRADAFFEDLADVGAVVQAVLG